MDGIVCTLQDLERAKSSSSLHCLTRGETIGLMLLVVAGLISTLAVLFAYILITRNVIRETQKRSGKRLIQQPMDLYILSLFTADLLDAVGSVMNVKWIAEGKSEIGTFCTAQGVINQAGPVAVALHTIVIAVVTFVAVWWRKGIPSRHSVKFHLRIASAVVVSTWLFVAILVAVPAGIDSNPSRLYWEPTPLWCTINKQYELDRLWAKYLWFWLALFISILVYVPLSFWTRGNITIDPETWWRFRIHRRSDAYRHDRSSRRLFFDMIAYPASNAILIVPLSIVRWIQNTGSNVITSTDSTAVVIVFAFSGITNVLLLLYIRGNLLLFGRDEYHCSCCAGLTLSMSTSDQLLESVERST